MGARRLFLIAFLALAAGCGRTAQPLETEEPDQPRTLTIVGISDFHGALQTQEIETADGKVVTAGGAALLSAYVDRIRDQAEGQVLVLDAGDMFQGTLASNLALGEPVVRFYNHLGLTAAAVGNHEFDFGPDTPERAVAVEPDDDPRGALKARAAQADFPFLAVNMRDEDGEVPDWAAGSHVAELEGIRVGIIGGATEDTAETTIGANVEGLSFPFAAPYIQAEADRLRSEEDVDMVVLTAHFGGGCRDFSDPDDLSSCRPGEMFRVLDALDAGTLQVAVGAHTHQGIAHRYDETAVLQSFAQGRALTWAVVDLDDPSSAAQIHGPVEVCGSTVEGRAGPTCHHRAVPNIEGPVSPALFLGEPIEPDPKVKALLADDFERVSEIRARLLGVEVEGTLSRAYREESPLGNLVADTMRAAFAEADVAVTNAGGVRATVGEGPMTYGDLFEVLPFDNRFVLLEVDKEALERMVRHGVTSGRSALLWSGLTYRAEGCEVTEVQVGQAPLDEEQTYTVVLNDYLAGGGSGFDTLDLPEPEVRWDLPPVRETVAEQLAELPSPLRAQHFFDPASPRQVREGPCEVAD